jgi:hypothetical protein
LLTGIGTLVAAMVALAILLVGEGVLFKGDTDDPAGPGPVGAGADAVEFEKKLGRNGTSGVELDSETGIVRNPDGNPDIVFYEASEKLGSFTGAIVEWTEDKPPTRQRCADLLETHGATGTYTIEIGARFCVRSSGGRTAFLAVINDGKEYLVSLWANG